ncbi:TetR/AcrR family transcriptional regulator [Aridibaculum aurantiacum]|uniref:TetR/AcrR family transcriptional regulator n=1 Tax=Aridibaculum aurantiacum TaxID=2810307 RepID=UPI001A96F53E|nr:TetR/AcrR family transcriptional regulator [Aridibaculum aurantiacum]
MANDNKRDAIIDAAQKRFSHFGVAKTTMNEIADDLSLSKASLYYYFPDKLNLFAAVLKKIVEAQRAVEPLSLKEKNLQKAIAKFLEARTEFIISNYFIIEYLRTMNGSYPPELEQIFSSARSWEINLIASILTNAKQSQGLKLKDPTSTAELLMDALEGLRFVNLHKNKSFIPQREQFLNLLKREKELATIFMNGLSA